MVSTGGGGGLPIGGPIEMVIALLVLVGVAWLAYQFFN